MQRYDAEHIDYIVVVKPYFGFMMAKGRGRTSVRGRSGPRPHHYHLGE